MGKFVSRPLLLLLAATILLSSCDATAPAANTAPANPSSANPATHLAAADSGDNRILIYDTPLTAGESASIVIGQTSFTQGLPNQGSATPSAATLYTPTGLTMDPAGNLWVADNNNCRVLEFRLPFSTGMSASLVIGEPDFETAGPRNGGWCDLEPTPPLASTYMGPPGPLAFDPQGDLWVVEAGGWGYGPDRVVEYVPPFSNGMAPSVAIGQPSLTDAYPCDGGEVGPHGPFIPPTAATLCLPTGIAFDAGGDLWVTDQGNIRILEFTPPFSTGMAASLQMVGQPSLAFEILDETACVDTSASSFCDPNAIAFDESGDLWIADSSLSRAQEFVPPFSDGMATSQLIRLPSPNELGATPINLVFDASGNLIVPNQLEGEILVYSPPFSTGKNLNTILTSGSVNCPSSGPAGNTLCNPIGVATF